MSLFTELELAALRARFGAERTDGGTPRDVDRLADQCAAEHARRQFHSPMAMLTRWLVVADEMDTDRLPALAFEPVLAVQRYPNSLVTDWGERANPEVAERELARVFEMLDGARS